MDSTTKPWFLPKRFGFGAGWPIAWRGWIVLGLFMATLLADLRFLPQPLKIWLAAILTVAFIVVVAAKTQGGLRWRWGVED